MSDNENKPEPKIIVDDDWKSQVEQEKEQLKSLPDEEAEAEMEGQMPEPSIVTVISLFATQAMSALGLLADPSTGEAAINRPLAKHFIDTLAVLQEKTKGNVTEEEASHFRDSLHQLRMIYVQMAQQQPPQDGADAGPTIELP